MRTTTRERITARLREPALSNTQDGKQQHLYMSMGISIAVLRSVHAQKEVIDD